MDFRKFVKPSFVELDSLLELFPPKYRQTKQNAAFLDLLYSSQVYSEYHEGLNLFRLLLLEYILISGRIGFNDLLNQVL